MAHQIATRHHDDENRRARNGQFPRTRKHSPQNNVADTTHEPDKSLRMGDESESGQRRDEDEFLSPPAPDEGRGEKSKSQRQVVIEKADVECPTVGEHCQARQQKPRWTPGNGRKQGKRTPKEDEYAKRHQNLLRRRQSKQISKLQKEEVEQDIVPLPGEVQSRGLPAFDQLREPRIVDMTAEVAGFNPPVPQTRDEQAHRN